MRNLGFAIAAAFVAGIAGQAHAGNEQATSIETRSAVTGAAADAATLQARPEPGDGAASLRALLAEWDQAGFSPPSKPAQYRVYGRDGFVTSGPGYNAMVSLIRSAIADARAGRDRDAAIKANKARGLLAASQFTKE